MHCHCQAQRSTVASISFALLFVVGAFPLSLALALFLIRVHSDFVGNVTHFAADECKLSIKIDDTVVACDLHDDMAISKEFQR